MGVFWSTTQQALPPPKDESLKTDTVILGAGVIGLATAYQLALAHRENAKAESTSPGSGIIVVERSAHISPAASGQATGGLGDFGFATGVAELGVLSYDLFQKVAFPGGPAEFGFSESTVYRITPDNFTGTPKPADDWGPTPPVEQPLSALPDWVKPKKHWSVQRMSGPPHASHLYLPMNSTASAGNHFRIRTPGWKPEDDRKGSEQVFFQNDAPDGQGLDITSFLGGELYVGGWGAIPEELPERAESIQAQPSEIESMKALTKQYLRIPEDDELDIFAVGRCYRPLATFKHPIITKVDWNLLGKEKSSQEELHSSKQTEDLQDYHHSQGGLYLNTAHFGDGVTLSLGSGKVMSELLLGLPPSIDISGLGLS
ncbi:unnamed protein product [Alternaria alternata]